MSPVDAYSRWFEGSVFPLLDRLNGTHIAAKLSLLLSSESLDPEEIERRQRIKLRRVIEFARTHSEFYAEHWRRAPKGPGSAFAELDGLPILTKADLVAARDGFPVPTFRGKVIISPTSGSTGSPMTFYRSAEQESWFWALRFRMWRWAGYHPGDPYLTINLNPRTQWRKRFQDRLFRCSYCTFNADNQDSRRIVETLRERRIGFLNGFASSLYVLARFMQDQGVCETSVRGLTSTGDSLFPVYRETIEAAFPTRVLDYYGAGGEGLHLASQCPESGSRYHLHPENAVVEVLGSEGPVAPGSRGRIVVTQLDNDAMPLVRYDLEDVAVPASPDLACPCGRSLPLLERIDGRAPDLIAVPDGTYLVPHFFVVLMKQLQTVHRYQILQDEPDRIRVRLVARGGNERRLVEERVREAVAAATRGRLGLEFEWTESIPLSGSGKRRLVLSSISRKLLGSGPA